MIWVRSRSFDSVFMMSGIWLTVLVVALHGTQLLTDVHYALAVLFWVGHRLTTTYIAYCQEAYREHLTKQRTRFVVIPAVVLVAVFALVMIPESVLPVPVLYRLIGLAALDFAWELYHFTMQHYGVMSIYRIRAGQDPGDVVGKQREKIYSYVVFGGLTLVAAAYHAAKGLAAGNPDFIVPGWAIQAIRIAGIGIAVGFTAQVLLLEAKMQKMSWPKFAYIASIGVPAAMLFVYDSMGPALLVVAVQHWLVSVGLTSHMAAGTAPTSAPPNAWYRFWNLFNRSPWAVMVLMCAGSAALAPVMEFSDVERRYVMRALRSAFDPASGTRSYVYWGQDYLDTLSTFGSEAIFISAFIAIGFSFGYIHYLMDRAIYRFSDPDTRRQTGPLIFQRR